jgi:hypothetical protein
MNSYDFGVGKFYVIHYKNKYPEFTSIRITPKSNELRFYKRVPLASGRLE